MAYFPTKVLDNQIKALPTVSTASGSVATFTTDKAENLVSCVCEVASGVSEINVVHKGVNLIDDSKYYQSGANNVVIGQTTTISTRTIFLKKGTYTIKIESTITATIYYNFGDGNISLGNTTEKRTFTLSNDCWCAFWLYKSGGFSPSDYTSAMLNFGNEALPYTSYNGNTYNIQLGETLTDTATYNATTGVLTRSDDTTKQLDSCPIVTLDNEENNLWSDTGDTSVKFILSVGEYVNQNV